MKWITVVSMWCETLLGRRVDSDKLHHNLLDGCFVAVPCAALEKEPTEAEIFFLGRLVERQFEVYNSSQKTLRDRECGTRSQKPVVVKTKNHSYGLYSLQSNSLLRWCVRTSRTRRFFSARTYNKKKQKEPDATPLIWYVDLMVFSTRSPAHMDLFIATEELPQRICLFRPMLSVLRVRRSESALISYDGDLIHSALMLPSTWIHLTCTIWQSAEQLSVEQWRMESFDANPTVILDSISPYFSLEPMVFREPSSKERFLVVAIRKSREHGGCVLIIGYNVGF